MSERRFEHVLPSDCPTVYGTVTIAAQTADQTHSEAETLSLTHLWQCLPFRGEPLGDLGDEQALAFLFVLLHQLRSTPAAVDHEAVEWSLRLAVLVELLAEEGGSFEVVDVDDGVEGRLGATSRWHSSLRRHHHGGRRGRKRGFAFGG